MTPTAPPSAMMPFMMSIWIVAAVGLTGVLLLVMGWRGRAVDDHPVCRKCRFDLTGVYPGAAACPECGADLAAASAVRVGNRRRPRPLLALGGVMTLLTVVLVLWTVWASINPSTLQQLKPVWWLRAEAANHGSTSSVAALDELLRRMNANTLSSSQLESVIDDALAVQADRSIAWETRWGDLIETARQQQQVSDAEWEAYAGVAAESGFEVRLRPRVRVDDPLPYRLIHKPARVGGSTAAGSSNSPFYVRIQFTEIRMGDQVIHSQGNSMGTSLSSSGGGWSSSVINSRRSTPPKPGVYEAILVLDLDVRDGGHAGPSVTQIQTTVTVPVEVVDADTHTVHPTHDPAITQAVHNALQAESIEFRNNQSYRSLAGLIRINHPPVDVAFDVYVHSDGREWRIGGVSKPANEETTWHISGSEIDGFDAARVDVILRPSRDVAVRTIDVFDYWGEEVVFKDVEVKWEQPPATQPAAPAASP